MNSEVQATQFYLPSGVSYNVQLIDFQEKNNQLLATIEVTPEVWESIDLVMLFNLTWENRNAGSVSGTKPLQIEMSFSSELYLELKKANKLSVDAKNFLALGNEHPLKSTKNWYILEVTEEIELPEELKHLGTLREGFATTWKK